MLRVDQLIVCAIIGGLVGYLWPKYDLPLWMAIVFAHVISSVYKRLKDRRERDRLGLRS